MVLDLPELGQVWLGRHHVVVGMELRLTIERSPNSRVGSHHDGWHCTVVCNNIHFLVFTVGCIDCFEFLSSAL